MSKNMSARIVLYKVVKKEDRGSVFVTGKYKKTYNDNDIVEADENTLGLMCFESIEQAENFSYTTLGLPTNTVEILKVEPLAPLKRVKCVGVIFGAGIESLLDNFYLLSEKEKNNRKKNLIVPIRKGTVCCHKIRVIGKV